MQHSLNIAKGLESKAQALLVVRYYFRLIEASSCII